MIKTKKYSWLPLFLVAYFFLSQVYVMAQPISNSPLIKNYTKKIYQGGTQNWDICEGDNGLVFYANNEGLLVFDGKIFSKHSLPKNTILRSILYDSKTKRIYAGGQNEMGYYQFETNGSLQYISIANLMPEGYKGFEDVWGIEEYEGRFYFQTNRQVFMYDQKSLIAVAQLENTLENIYKVGKRLFLTDIEGSIFELKGGQFNKLISKSGLDISSILARGNNQLLITTYKNGLYFYQDQKLVKVSNNQELFKVSRIYKACNFGSNYILGSNRNGVFILDSNAQIIKNISNKDGLQNNNVLSVYKDANHNIWLGLDNGIDLLRTNYPFAYVVPDGLLKGTGYCMAEFGDSYYFGTNNGLYAQKKNNNSNFELIANTEGQVWWVQEINGKLFVCHHEGLFEVQGNTANKISEIRGCWKIIPLKSNLGFFALGTYNGISIFNWQNNTLSFVATPSPFKESSRFLEEDELGNIWVAHPYKGLYKIRLNNDLQSVQNVKLFGTKEGLPSQNENYVFNTQQGLSFCTSKGVYEFREDYGRFQPAKNFNGLLDNKDAFKRLYVGKNGKLWFINNHEIGFIKPIYDGVEYSFSKVLLPKLDQNLVGGFDFLHECGNGNVFLGVESGFEQFNLNQIGKFKPVQPQTLITAIHSLEQLDSVYFKYLGPQSNPVEINDRSIEFSYSSTNANFFNDLSFSSYLEGWEKDWSPYKSSTNREFSRLSFGDYSFHIKAKCLGIEGPETIIKIHIPAPWYWTKVAKFIYSFIGIIIVLLIGFFPQMLVRKKAIRIIAEKDTLFKQQTESLKQEKDQKDKELIELKNQQLQQEIEHQGRELASSTMHIVQKSEMLLSIKDKLKHISSISNDPKIKPEISDLIKNIEKDTIIDRDWEKFELYFNNIHDRFTLILKERFPVFTANDIKMCAYLRMNLSTKEIATILNISVRGVEISRYRLRKKMGLDNGANLTEYLSKI
jgi:ligand-binding sensor domain-containing protein/DNA-binding CsgD family transcriptional regulator